MGGPSCKDLLTSAEARSQEEGTGLAHEVVVARAKDLWVRSSYWKKRGPGTELEEPEADADSYDVSKLLYHKANADQIGLSRVGKRKAHVGGKMIKLRPQTGFGKSDRPGL